MTTKALLFITIAAWCLAPVASDHHYQSFRDYAPVLGVEPITQFVSTPKPPRNCPERPALTAIAPSIGEDIHRQLIQHRSYRACKAHMNAQSQPKIAGYWVTYRYRDHISRVRLPYPPGDRIRVDISLAPIE